MIDLDSIADLSKGRIPSEIYVDPDLYQMELENVFGRTWLFLAHDSQLPKSGSFVQTYMGEDPVLVVRQRDGSVKAFLNQCTHRGMRICRSEAGTAKAFTCSYHGWAYDIEGNLINVPGEKEAYHGEIDKSRWGAAKVPRMVNYKGFWFGCWSEDTPDFLEYLGDMAYYIDASVDRWDNGLEFVPGVTRWVIDANWKFAAEQFASDLYHTPISHASAMVALSEIPHASNAMPSPDLKDDLSRLESITYGMRGSQFTGNGHGTSSLWMPGFPTPMLGNDGPEYAQWLLDNRDEAIRRVGEDRLKKVTICHTVFPTFSWLTEPSTMRVWHPRGPNQIEVWAWTYMPKDAPQKVKDEIRQAVQRTFSVAGVFETDDGENWTETQRVLRGWKARTTRFNSQMGLGHEEEDVNGLPGTTNAGFAETAAIGFYQRWSDLVRGLSWEEINKLDADRKAAKVASV
ncbi:3-phenylpropionate dioxygenase [Rhodococcus sp. 05-340-1]|nr:MULTISPECIES: aromatic ring-hydroxylating dioxygenase subunit alpha [unclassified Rhodococcus (in: high G+C Gram-positive bacteria)]OZD68879.1 3-phenylpropionate dioxygenase [Rhodococcus sp. 05-340-2]OZD69352.1 3-phenylpropionate dioxygenase [Rhodococcus sp. 05-340-1]